MLSRVRNFFSRGDRNPDIDPNIRYVHERRRINIYTRGGDICRIYRVDEAPDLPHHVVLETGYEGRSGYSVYVRGPAEDFRKLGDSEYLPLNASVRMGIGREGREPEYEVRFLESSPELVIRSIPIPKQPDYEPVFTRITEYPYADMVDITTTYFGRESFRGTNEIRLSDSPFFGGLRAFSIFRLENEYGIFNDGQLHLFLAPSDANQFEYVPKGDAVIAENNYLIGVGLSPLKPPVVLKLTDVTG